MSLRHRLSIALLAGLLLSACGTADVGPINSFVANVGPGSPQYIPDPGDDGSVVVGLALSGGGTRAAAFAYGVMRELDEIVIDDGPRVRTLLDDVRMISGTSGGSVLAAYFGYRGRDGYRDFRERFLIHPVEDSMRTSIHPANLVRAWRGGVNDRTHFARWMDENLFQGATFDSFKRPNAPIVWLTATDIYHGTPFLFTYDTFAALCSDLDKVSLADAVAASAAVPVVFHPIVVSTGAPDCGYRHPAWLERALADSRTPLRLQAYARALDSYRHSDALRHVRLVDGAFTDNIGITGLALERAAADTPHGPLSPEEAVKLRTLLFVVADAGRDNPPDWGEQPHGPNLAGLLPAVSRTAISSLVRDGYDALELALAQWRDELVRYRCGLSESVVRRHRGTLAGWNCRDVKIVTEHLSFRDLPPATRTRLNAVPTRLALPVDEVDLVVQAGRDAVRANRSIRDLAADVQSVAGVRQRYAPGEASAERRASLRN